MNVLTQTWRQLVRRRLWPVALLLVAALVAVPVVLAKPADPAPAPAASAPGTATAAAPVATPEQSYVKLASDDGATRHRRVLGARKDPFEPAPLPKVKHHKKTVKHAVTAQATATATATPSAPSSASPAAGGGAVVPVATATPAPVKRVPANSVEVAFGKTGDELAKSTLQRDDTLPSSSPLVVFMGFHKGGKVAEFMLTGTVTAEGDGSCSPSALGCETLRLRKGETEFLTFSGTSQDGQYELDIKDLHSKS